MPDRALPPPPIPDAMPEAEERFRLLAEGALDHALIMLDPGGRIAAWNSGAERLYGWAAAEILGRAAAVLYAPAEVARGWPRHDLDEAAIHGRIGAERAQVRRDGTQFVAECVLTALPVDGADDGAPLPRGVALLVRDLTERRRCEAAVRHAQDEWVATLTHELRTPLTSILGWTRVLRSKTHDPAALARALDLLERSTRSEAQLVEDILDLSLVVTGKLLLERSRVALAPLVQHELAAAAPEAAVKALHVTATLANGADDADAAVVKADRARLGQVVRHLLANAMKFTPHGGAITVTLAREAASAVLTIADSGEGIRADFLPQLFTAFRQGDGSSTRRHGGLGIGLALVRHLVELHGGRVSGASGGQGRGAAFTVWLPLA